MAKTHLQVVVAVPEAAEFPRRRNAGTEKEEQDGTFAVEVDVVQLPTTEVPAFSSDGDNLTTVDLPISTGVEVELPTFQTMRIDATGEALHLTEGTTENKGMFITSSSNADTTTSADVPASMSPGNEQNDPTTTTNTNPV